MSFPNQDYLAMLKGKPPYYPQVQQPQQTPMIYSNPQFMQPYMNFMPQYMMMQQIQQMQQMPSMPPMRMPMPTSPMPMPSMTPLMMPYPLQPPNPPQPKLTQNIPVTVKGTKVKLNLALIRDLPVEEDSVLDYDEIKKQKGDQQFIALKRKRRLIDQQETPIMQTRRRSEQSQYLEIREILQIDDKDMGVILEAYPDTKTLLQELKNGNLKNEIEELLLK